MEDGGGQTRVHAIEPEHVEKILAAARAARCDDGHGYRLAHGPEHFQIKAPAHAVGVDGVDHDLARAAVHAAPDPVDGIQPRIVTPAARKDVEAPVHALDIHAQHHTLVSVALGRAGDERRVADGAAVDADLVRAAFEHAVKVVQGIDAAAHGEGDEHLRRHGAKRVRKQRAPLGAGGDVVKHQLICAGIVVKAGEGDRVVHVAQALEVHTLDHPAVSHVQAGDDAPGQHGCASPLAMASARSSLSFPA